MSHAKNDDMHFAPSADSIVSESEVENRLQNMQAESGQQIQRNGEGAEETPNSPTQAIVSASGKFTQVRAKTNQSGATTLDELSPFNRRALEQRAELIDRNYEGETIETTMPIQVLETARKWLRSKNLIWASNDVAFWSAFEYVLGSMESFSVEAVEQALIICSTSAVNDAARRTSIYRELKVSRAIKRIRDMEMKIRTAQVVANHTLSIPYKEHVEDEEAEAKREAEAKVETKKAYAVFQMPDAYFGADGEYKWLFENPSDAQIHIQDVVSNPSPHHNHRRQFEIRLVGVNAAGKPVWNYGVVDENGNANESGTLIPSQLVSCFCKDGYVPSLYGQPANANADRGEN